MHIDAPDEHTVKSIADAASLRDLEAISARLIEFPHQRPGMVGGYCRTPAPTYHSAFEMCPFFVSCSSAFLQAAMNLSNSSSVIFPGADWSTSLKNLAL